MNNDYLMGLLTADGCQKKYTTTKGELHISMTIELKDKQILEDLSKEVKNKVNCRIRGSYTHYYMHISYKYLEGNGQYFDKYRTGIYNYYKNCANKLDFIRGLFDGDGGICLRTTRQYKYWSIYFVVNSQQKEIKDILDDFAKTYNFVFSIYFDKRGLGCYNYNISKDSEIKRFYNLLYGNKPKFYLQRKYEKFLENGCPKMETF